MKEENLFAKLFFQNFILITPKSDLVLAFASS